MRELERVVLLRVVDEYWMDHIDAMSDLRQGIRLRAYAQTDPIIAYKKESPGDVRGDDRRHPGRDRPAAVLRAFAVRTRRSSASGWPTPPPRASAATAP